MRAGTQIKANITIHYLKPSEKPNKNRNFFLHMFPKKLGYMFSNNSIPQSHFPLQKSTRTLVYLFDKVMMPLLVYEISLEIMIIISV